MEKFRVGVIGCGVISPMHFVPIVANEQCQLVAVCDNKPERAMEAGKKYDVAYFTDYKEMINASKLDVVHICTPHYLHAEMAIYAAQAKVNVLTEKPMAITLADAQQMVSVAEQNGVILGVIFQNRYNPGSILVKKSLKDGSLGEILGAKMSLTWSRSDEYYSQSDWKGTWEKEGGGVVIDQAIHTIDLMNWLIDKPVLSVEGSISNRAHEIIEVEDSAEGVIKYEGGVLGHYNCINYYPVDDEIEIELVCEKGTAKIVSSNATVTFKDGTTLSANVTEDDMFTYDDGAKGYWGSSHVKQINNYYDCLKKGTPPDITGKQALPTQSIIEQIYASK